MVYINVRKSLSSCSTVTTERNESAKTVSFSICRAKMTISIPKVVCQLLNLSLNGRIYIPFGTHDLTKKSSYFCLAVKMVTDAILEKLRYA